MYEILIHPPESLTRGYPSHPLRSIQMCLKIRHITNMCLKCLKLGTIKAQKVVPLLLILFYPSQAWIKQEFIFLLFFLGFEVLFESENKDFYYIKS